MLAPTPDFRYVGVLPKAPWSARRFAPLVVTGAAVGATLGHAYGARAAVLGTLAATCGMALSLVPARSRALVPPRNVSMGIVPWGILLEHEAQPRVLHWGAITRVHVGMTYGRDGASDFTSWSVVTVETEREAFTGCAPGAVPLERLIVHLEAYAREQSHAVALDLDGEKPDLGPVEPHCEPLLRAARAWVDSAPASSRLELQAAGYRRVTGRLASPRALDELRQVLRDRTEKDLDPRPFAAVVAAELGARALVDDLVALVQSPHPVVAAVAKAAGRRLGVARARTGTLDEVAPFLMPHDLETLEAWSHDR